MARGARHQGHTEPSTATSRVVASRRLGASDAPVAPNGLAWRGMERPSRFEHSQFVGDKRNQLVHDVDACDSPVMIAELMSAETYICFQPDSLAEARNRGYRRCEQCPAARSAAGRHTSTPG